jgi:hypothetical protein
MCTRTYSKTAARARGSTVDLADYDSVCSLLLNSYSKHPALHSHPCWCTNTYAAQATSLNEHSLTSLSHNHDSGLTRYCWLPHTRELIGTPDSHRLFSASCTTYWHGIWTATRLQVAANNQLTSTKTPGLTWDLKRRGLGLAGLACSNMSDPRMLQPAVWLTSSCTNKRIRSHAYHLVHTF